MPDTSLESIAAELARRTDAFECFRTTSREITVNFEAGKLKTAQTNERAGVGLRVVVGGRVAVGGTPDPSAIAATIDSTIEAAAFGDAIDFAFAPKAVAPAIDIHDPAAAALTVEALVATGRDALARLGDLGPGVTASVTVETSRATHQFLNSVGQRCEYSATSADLAISVECFAENDIFSLYEISSGSSPRTDADALAAAVRTRFEQARAIVPAGASGQPIVFMPQALGPFLWPLASALNGQSVVDGVSPLAGKRGGDAFLAESLTLVDDATIVGRPASQPVDDEGVPARRTVLIDRGRVSSFLLDLRTAARLGLPSTGHAHRSLTSPPRPAMSNSLMAPGHVPLATLIGSIDDGLLIESLLGVGQGNVMAGDYATPIGLAYKIRGGKIVGRVKECSLAGNLYTDLKSIGAIEDCAHWHGPTCLPHIRMDHLELAVK